MTLVDGIAEYSLCWIIAILMVEGWIWFGFRDDFPIHKNHQWEAVRFRLRGYAFLKPEKFLKPGTKEETKGLSSPDYLSSDPHEILLGTLKKVEQKNAVLVTIIVFALSVMAGSLLSPGDYTSYDHFVSVCMASLAPPLFLSFLGMRQLDQRDFRLLGVQTGEKNAAMRLQDSLISDLMVKERAFHFSRFCTQYAVVGFIFIVVANTVQIQELRISDDCPVACRPH